MHRMNEPWTADVVGRMHLYGITQSELAKKCNYTPQYINQILNCKKSFSSDELKIKTKKAIYNSLTEIEQEVRDERVSD